jgi:type IV secretion system protein VirB6
MDATLVGTSLMAGSCFVPATGDAFLSGLLQHIDCQAQTLGETGYQALANPGSSVSLALTALLTIFIALFGIRMLLGLAPSLSDVVTGSLKIGIVLMLATSWAAYRVVAYDVVLRGPAELVEDIGSPSGLPGAGGGLMQRLQNVDDAIMAFIVIGAGRFDATSQASAGSSVTVPATRTPVSDDFAFGIARILYLAGTVGALGFVRLVGGLLLALAPLFAGLLLFDATRGFFMGWLRMLVASALGALAVAIILGIELSIVEPWLSHVLALRAARYATPAAPVELLVIMLAFTALLVAVIGVGVRVAFNPSVPSLVLAPARRLADALTRTFAAPSADIAYPRQDLADNSRAFLVADAIAANQRREAALTNDNSLTRAKSSAGPRMTTMARDDTTPAFVPLGRAQGRTLRRVSASATRRSQRT